MKKFLYVSCIIAAFIVTFLNFQNLKNYKNQKDVSLQSLISSAQAQIAGELPGSGCYSVISTRTSYCMKLCKTPCGDPMRPWLSEAHCTWTGHTNDACSLSDEYDC